MDDADTRDDGDGDVPVVLRSHGPWPIAHSFSAAAGYQRTSRDVARFPVSPPAQNRGGVRLSVRCGSPKAGAARLPLVYAETRGHRAPAC